jgi:hypothetical protein
MRDTVENDSPGVVDQSAQLWLPRGFQQHLLHKKTCHRRKKNSV